MNRISRRLILPALICGTFATSAHITVTRTTVDHIENPASIPAATPRFSWQTESDKSGVVQKSYRIIVSSTPEKAANGEGDLWDSGIRASRQQTLVPYGGKTLKDGTRAWWSVRIDTNKGASRWSAPAPFGVGPLGENRWGGRWIGLESHGGDNRMKLHTELPARYLRKEFRLKELPVRRATAHISGLGLYRLFINGAEVAPEEVLKPAPSDYRRTVYYNTYDVTDRIDTLTAVGIMLGNGRYFPPRANKPHKIPYFGLPTCRLNLIVEYADGSRQRLATDETWRVTDRGPIRSNNEYDGETYDARLELDGWTRPGFDDSAWQKAERSAIPYGTLRAQPAPNMRADTLGSPLSVSATDGKLILDFGENMAGHVAFRPRGNRGDTIRIRYAEKLDSDGSIFTANLRDALSTDTYICSGNETGRFWSPSFTYHGFRYAEVSGLPGAVAEDFAAIHTGDPVGRAGSFACSDTILNRVIENAARGIRSNYKGMPVDCPQRNERQPWLGDRAAGALGETFLFDNAAIYSKWVRDICEAQREDGCIPDVAPAFWNYYTDNVTWPAALPFVCDMLLTRYGDTAPAAYAYPHIAKWMRHILDEYSRGGIVSRDRYGDWCVPPERLDLIHSEDPSRKTDGALIATAYTIECLRLLAKFAALLEQSDDAARWQALRKQSVKAFNDKFLTIRRGTSRVPGHTLYPDSVFYGNNTATANVLPLAFGIAPDSLRSEIAKNIVTDIITRDNGHIPCGVIGTSWLLRALSDQGYGEIAWLLATNSTYPSWGYMAENGATTIWELWNGDKARPWMNSGNHVMLLGDLLAWCFRELGGFRPGDAGNHFVLRPDFSIPDCEWAEAEIPTPFGPVLSYWKKTLMKVDWEVTLPPNTTATVILPDGRVREAGSGTHRFTSAIPARDPAIVTDEFLYTSAPFPQCHAATMVETRRGDLVAAYFGGTHERHPDVCVWVSRKPRGADRWEAPIMAADGVMEGDSVSRKACWNPVLFEMPDGELWLFFKIGSRVADWTGWLTKSKDGGRTWSPREPLPEGFLGPVKNKPELIGNRLVCPSSTERGGWKLHFEILDLATGEWRYVGPVAAELAYRTDDLLPDGTPAPGARKRPVDCIQPSLLRLSDGRLMVLARTRNGRLAASYSSDGGDTWSSVTLTDLPNNQSGTDAVTLSDGRHVLVYTDFATLPGTKKGPRTPLRVAVSDDDGNTWRNVVTLEDSPVSQYSYPAVIAGRDGTIHTVYTWRRERVAHKALRLPPACP